VINSLRSLVFDLDGTLVDSAPGILASFAATLQAAHVEPKLPLEPGLIGPPLQQTLAQLAGSDDPTLLAKLVTGFKSHYDTQGIFSTPAYGGISELLDELSKRGINLHICTNKRIAPTRALVGHLGWQSHFRSLYALDMRSPPFAGKSIALAEQLREQGIDPYTTAYIGDRREDAEAAEANGLAFFYASWGYGAEKQNQAPAHWRWLDTPIELLAYL